MLKIYIARHGQDEDNANGILNGRRNQPLTAWGLQQAANLADKIAQAGLRFDAIYSSPLQRASVTAQAVANQQGQITPVPLESLIERDFGIMTGKPVASIEAMCAPDIIKAEKIVYFLSPPGAETFPMLLQRGQQVLDEIQARHASGSILLVAHGDIGKMVYAAYYGIAWEKILTMFHFDNSELLLLAPDSPAEAVHFFKW